MSGRGRNAAAFERTVAALRNVGRIEPADAALVAVGRTLAAKLDNPEVVTETRDDDLSAFLAVLSTQMGDATES